MKKKKKKKSLPTVRLKKKSRPKYLIGVVHIKGGASCPSCFKVLSPSTYSHFIDPYLFFKCTCKRVVRVFFPSSSENKDI